MAIYHLQIHVVRKAGSTVARSAHHGGHRLSHGATGRAAYLSAARFEDSLGLVTDYTSKAAGIEHSELFLPDGTEQVSREELWRAVDAHPTRSPNAVVARDIIVALPCELSAEDRIEAARKFCQTISNRYHVAVDLGVHYPDVCAGSSEKNSHFHALVAERMIEQDGTLSTLQTDFDAIAARCAGREPPVEEIRQTWQRIGNEALEAAGFDERIDRRSLSAQGIEREPGRHLGRELTRELRMEEASISAGMRSVAELRADLADLSETMAARSRAATQRIEDIQAARRTEIDRDISSHIGSVEDWTDDAAGAFMRAWKSEDRAQQLRHKLQAISENMNIMRDATEEEAAELKACGRSRSKAATLQNRIERISHMLDSLESDDLLLAGSGPMTKKRVTHLEQQLTARSQKLTQEHDIGMEL